MFIEQGAQRPVVRSTELPQQLMLGDRLFHQDREVVTTVITLEEQMRGWLALLHRVPEIPRQVAYYERVAVLGCLLCGVGSALVWPAGGGHLHPSVAAGRADRDDRSDNCGHCLSARCCGVVGQSARFSAGAWAARRRLAAPQCVMERQSRPGQQAICRCPSIQHHLAIVRHSRLCTAPHCRQKTVWS